MSSAWDDATSQAEQVRAGKVSPLELVEAAIERIERLNPELNAVITPMFESARAEAVQLTNEEAGRQGRFGGVPFLLKDLGCHCAGARFCQGTRALRDAGYVAEADTELAVRFRKAGLIFLGKTNTPELGILPTTEPEAFGATRNPWDPSRSAGGSSGGSAAAVAAGLVAAAHGNDGGGSIRIPASECGLVGLKPTRARTTLAPEVGDVMNGLVCEHVLTRSVRDSAAILDAVAGPAVGDPYPAPPASRPYLAEVGADPGTLRVGLLTTTLAGEAHPDCVEAARATGALLESLGHVVEESHPAALEEPDFVGSFLTLWAVGNVAHVEYIGTLLQRELGEDDVEPLTWALVEMGRQFSGAQYLAAVAWLQSWARRVQSWWAEGFDILLTPTVAEPPPPLGEFVTTPDNPLGSLFRAAALVPFTPPFNVTGQPAISLPLHWSSDGLPIGSQLVAGYGREDLLFRVASQLETAKPWSSRHPAVAA